MKYWVVRGAFAVSVLFVTVGGVRAGGDCPSGATGSCCETHPTPGCDDSACCNAVCAAQPLCCDPGFSWVNACRDLAFDVCGDKCEMEVCAEATGSCCKSHPTPGCDDPACCNAVCAAQPLCCDPGISWVNACRDLAFDVCGDKCEMEVCAEATGSCCDSHPTPGCDDPACCNAVCAAQPLCCDPGFSWVNACRDLAFDVCGDKCEMEVCAEATGSCCDSHPTPGCDDPACCNAVCAAQPLCCDPGFSWVTACRDLAVDVCGTLCTGACCGPDSCRQTTPEDCTMPGAFQGLHTECEPEQPCCFPDGTCVADPGLAPVCCTAAGGVTDTEGPTITCPEEIVVRCVSPDGLPADSVAIEFHTESNGVLFNPREYVLRVVVGDDCGEVTMGDNRPDDFYPPSCPNDRPTVLTFTARDECGNESTCQTRVFVYGPMCCPGFVDEELTLLPADVDLRQETNGPTITKGNFDIWNQDERRFSGTHRCVNCWDQSLLSEYAAPNHFLRGMIHTDKGKARVDGLQSDVCPGSVESPMVGVFTKEITFPGRITEVLRSAITPVGTGSESATIRHDIVAPPQNALASNVETSKRQNVETSEPRPSGSGLDANAIDSSVGQTPTDDRSLTVAAPMDATRTGTVAGINPGGRGDITRKGSLLIWPRVEVRWNAHNEVIEDTFLTLANDDPGPVDVQLYLVNGDAPLEVECDAPCIAGLGANCVNFPQCIVERAHPGWNKSDVQLTLTANQPTYWSAATGQVAGVSSFDILDPGDPPGRPDTDPRNPGGRVIRGFVMGWAVNAEGHEIHWNHLTGSAMLIQYDDSSAAEYNAWAFQCVADVEPGAEPDGTSGQLNLDGLEYEIVPDALIFDFYSVGSSSLSHPGVR